MKEIEKDIKEIIEEVIKGKYIGKLKVVSEPIDDSTLWMLLLYLDLELTPMVLAHEGTLEEFKEFVAKEMKERKLQTVKFWRAVQEYPSEIENDCDESG